jgi:hypothetical protein
MGVSWEIIIHLYRAHLVETNKRFAALEEYPSDFIQFIKDNADILFSQEQQDNHASNYLEGIFRNDLQAKILARIQQSILNNASPVTESEITTISLEVLEEICHRWENAASLNSSNELQEDLRQRYEAMFNDKYAKYLGGLPLPSDAQNRIWTLFVNLFIKDYWMFTRFTGVAFAGFGDEELFPSFTTIHFESYVAEYLKCKITGVAKIDTTSVATIIPLAQDDIVQTFLGGVHPIYESILNQHVKDFQQISHIVQGEMKKRFTDPIINIVASLPKDELANMAETLVSMTSFMRRVSSNLETVGGPIDVAVISKKDGFVWIQRKHYFPPELNYHFFDEKRSFQ